MLAPITIRFPLAMMREIEAIQKSRMDEPDKGQVVRELVAAGLQKRKASK
jgi:cold shock CspA family protein